MISARTAATLRLQIMLSACFILWMAFVLILFYAVKEQKPIQDGDMERLRQAAQSFTQPASGLAAADSLLNVIVALAITLAAAVIGFRINPLGYPLDALGSARAEFWLLSIPLGFGVLALITFALSLFAWLTPIAAAALALSLLLLRPQRALLALWRDLNEMRSLRVHPLVALFVALSLALALLASLAPPTAWDALVYHLTIPRRALELGRLAPSGDIIPHENFPLLMSSLYLLAMFLKGDIAAQLLHFTFGLLTLGLIALAAQKIYGRGALAYALLLALALPMLLLLSSWAYNDVALACYTLAAVYAYQRWRDSVNARYVVVSALMSGCALALKYTSFVLPLGIVLMMLYDSRHTLSLKPPLHDVKLLRDVAKFVLLSLLVASAWYIKNFLFTGNPVYPFVFGGTQWDAMRAAWYARGGSGIGFEPLALLTLPIVATLGVRDANFYDGRMGPLVLMLAPLLALNRPRVDRFVFMFLIQFAFWVIGVIGSASLWQTRLLLPALVLLVPPLAAALRNLSRFDLQSFSLRRITTIVVALVLALTFIAQTVSVMAMNPLAYMIGAESREHFLTRDMGDHADALLAINQLPTNARVQFMWEPRSYLAQRSVRADPLLDALPHLVATNGSLDAGVQQMKRDGFTHVLVYETGARFTFDNIRDEFSADDARNLATLERDHMRVVYENGSYRLMELK